MSLILAHGLCSEANLHDLESSLPEATVRMAGKTVWIETTDTDSATQVLKKHDWITSIAELEPGGLELVVDQLMGKIPYSKSPVSPRIDRKSLSYEVRYQPIVGLTDQKVIGYEALMRADSPQGHLDGDALIAKATAEGWLAELDIMGRKLALESLGSWLGEGLLFLNMMAPGGVFDLSAIRSTISQAEEIGLDPDQIVFETTERNKYHNMETASAQLSKLREMGPRLAIDDLGEGYSSLLVATSFKPDILKISGELVAQLPSNEALAAIEAIATLGHGSGMWIVAEKIETTEQRDLLRELEIDWGQGHLFGAAKQMG